MKKNLLFLAGAFTLSLCSANANELVTDTANSEIKVQIPEVGIASHLLNLPFLESNKDVIVLSQSDFNKHAILQPVDLLKYISDIEVRERGPNGVQSDIKLSGGTFEQVLILINGHKVMDAQTGHHLMNLPISMDQVTRVEILKGAAARLYGINSLVGAINFVIDDEGEISNLKAHVSTGSNFERNEDDKIYGSLNAQVSGNWSNGSASHLLSVAYHKGNGYRYNTAYEQAKLFYNFSKKWKESTTINWFASGIYNDFGTNGFYSAPNDKESVETVATAFTGLEVKTVFSKTWSSALKMSYRYNFDDYRFIKTNPSFYQNIHHNQLAQVNWMNKHDFKWLDLRWGVDYNQNWIRSTNLGDWDRNNMGAFVDLLPKWNFPVKVNGGLYVNYNQDWGLEWLPGIDASYRILPWMSVFAGWSTGQRNPTYTDLFYTGPNNVGNADLLPEHSQQFELGLKAEKGKFYVQATVFNRKVDNLIDWVRNDINDPWVPDNFGEVHTQGVNVNGKFESQIRATAFRTIIMPSYTYLNSETSHFEGVISNYQLQYLKHKIALLTQLVYNEKWTIAPGYRYEQRMSNSSFHIVDLRASYQHDYGQVYVDVNNLTNVKQVDAHALPLVGRWVSLGLRFNLR